MQAVVGEHQLCGPTGACSGRADSVEPLQQQLMHICGRVRAVVLLLHWTGSLHVGIINPGNSLAAYNFTAGQAVIIPAGACSCRRNKRPDAPGLGLRAACRLCPAGCHALSFSLSRALHAVGDLCTGWMHYYLNR